MNTPRDPLPAEYKPTLAPGVRELLAHALELRSDFTYPELADKAGCSMSTVRNYLTTLRQVYDSKSTPGMLWQVRTELQEFHQRQQEQQDFRRRHLAG